ncbi:hypothetical protein O181_021533 [Austropuccinia psidii MF-1]|uniref:Uncharacterized protein n=1 Tax=Austropuccinia psidii MF-1 TaxID=1389203 RepID=A0A9Q3CDJ0_9BASI|nr:hypothetical protein [Austropuccinia psidii MF-1]
MFKKLRVDADELEGLLAQAACHAPPNLGQVAFNQLVTAAILVKGDKKPLLTFVGQVIMNALQKNTYPNQHSSPSIYCVSEPLAPAIHLPCPCSPHFSKPVAQAGDVRCPPEHLVDKFGGSCFYCRCMGHWRADWPHTRGVANPNPQPPIQYARGHLCTNPSLFQTPTISGSMCPKSNLLNTTLLIGY